MKHPGLSSALFVLTSTAMGASSVVSGFDMLYCSLLATKLNDMATSRRKLKVKRQRWRTWMRNFQLAERVGKVKRDEAQALFVRVEPISRRRTTRYRLQEKGQAIAAWVSGVCRARRQLQRSWTWCWTTWRCGRRSIELSTAMTSTFWRSHNAIVRRARHLHHHPYFRHYFSFVFRFSLICSFSILIARAWNQRCSTTGEQLETTTSKSKWRCRS